MNVGGVGLAVSVGSWESAGRISFTDDNFGKWLLCIFSDSTWATKAADTTASDWLMLVDVNWEIDARSTTSWTIVAVGGFLCWRIRLIRQYFAVPLTVHMDSSGLQWTSVQSSPLESSPVQSNPLEHQEKGNFLQTAFCSFFCFWKLQKEIEKEIKSSFYVPFVASTSFLQVI